MDTNHLSNYKIVLNMKRNIIYILLILIAVVITTSCDKHELGNPLPSTVADFTEAISNQSYAPCEITFTNKSLNATGYLWNFGNGQTSTEENPTVQYATPGLYTVTLTCTSPSDLHYNQLVKTKVINIKDITAAVSYLRSSITNDEVILLMGAGDVFRVGEELLCLKKKK